MPLKNNLMKALNFAEDSFDFVWQRAQRFKNRNRDVTILPYMGFGTATMLRLRGRVLENHKVAESQGTDSRWRNLLNVYRRFDSDEIPNAQITARFGDQVREITADKEGFFIVQFDLDEPLPPHEHWHDIHLSYDDGRRQSEEIGRVIVPPVDAQFGVISDLDDTVVRTDVTNLLKLVRNTFLHNAHTRLPFHGVAEFYTALQQGITANTFNPIYYVSNSPYNLYDLLTDFFEVRGIPLGPVFLRDMGLTERYLLASKQHKFETIDRLLTTYADLPFILIGDSGEHDPDIYLQVAQMYPNRIIAIYIRDVAPDRPDTRRALRRNSRIQQVMKEVQAAGSEMLLIPDTAAAALHAVEKGFIQRDTLGTLIEAAKDESQANRVNEVLEETSN